MPPIFSSVKSVHDLMDKPISTDSDYAIKLFRQKVIMDNVMGVVSSFSELDGQMYVSFLQKWSCNVPVCSSSSCTTERVNQY